MSGPRRRALSALVVGLGLAVGCSGEHIGPGEVTAARVPAEAVAARQARTGAAPRQILFGDLHVHTSFSPDALVTSMPLMGGDGAHPPADACDFARFCAGLDFWSINDHAEGITPRRWAETRETIRACNAAAGDPANPDMVSFLGWEWSQVSLDRNAHWGHKNVVLLDTADDRVPRRPIAAPRDQLGRAPMGAGARLAMQLADWENRQLYRDFGTYYEEIAATPLCATDVDTRELPDDCLETAADPAALFRKLDEWGYESIVIPHGNSWGLNTPPGTSFDKQLDPEQHDPDRQILWEVYSGHGSAEEYREYRHVEFDAEGGNLCPAPTPDFTPCCWRAGEIIRERCEDPDSADCEARVVEARQNHVDASVTGYWTVPGTEVADWLDCGQCRDCFAPPFDHRPATTAQYALALSRPSPTGGPDLRFRFGLIGSSDNHSGRGGTGYKEFARYQMADASGPQNERIGRATFMDDREPAPRSVRYDHGETRLGLNKLRHMDRQGSFWMTGGLVATHANGRDRRSIWEAWQRREVYATSGDRILLWFEHLGTDGRVTPMGAELGTTETPRFRVRAVGAHEQLPGCPAHSERGLGAERLARLCLGECHNPGERRRRITRVEVVRIRPRVAPDEPIAELVEDPWRVFPCPEDEAGCQVEFEDEAFAAGGREVLYYVRAIQEPTPAVNADTLRCQYDEAGRCVKVDPCYGDYRTPMSDDCLADLEERAWSSPIFLRPAG